MGPVIGARSEGQDGSALVLVPVLLLVLLVLGAICVNSATEWLGHRALEDFATSAADQAASAALDKSAFYGDGQAGGHLVINAQEAGAVVDQVRAVSSSGGLTISAATVVVSQDGDTVTVVATGTVRDVFGPAVGGRPRVTLTARGHQPRWKRFESDDQDDGYLRPLLLFTASFIYFHSMICERSGSGVAAHALLREAEILGRCRHPGVVELRTAAVDGEIVSVITDLPPGTPLGTATLTVEEVAGVVAVLATTISDLHEIGVAHLRIDASAVHLGFDGRPVLDRFDGATFLDGPARRWPVHRLAGEDDRALGELFRTLLSGSVGGTVRVASEHIPPHRWPRARLRWSRVGGPRRGAMTSLVVWAARAARGEVTARELAEAMAVGVTGARLPAIPTSLPVAGAGPPAASRRELDGSAEPGGQLDGFEPHLGDVPAPFSDAAIDAWIAAAADATPHNRGAGGPGAFMADLGLGDRDTGIGGWVAEPASGDRQAGGPAWVAEPRLRDPASKEHEGFVAVPLRNDRGAGAFGRSTEPTGSDGFSAWAPFAPVAAADSPDGREATDDPQATDDPEAPDAGWTVAAPRWDSGRPDHPGRWALGVLGAAALIIIVVVLLRASSSRGRPAASPRHRGAGSGHTSGAAHLPGGSAPFAIPPGRGAASPAGASGQTPTTPPALSAAPPPTAVLPPSVTSAVPSGQSSPRPALQFCVTVPAGAAPACTVGTYAQGVLHLGSDDFVLGRAGDVVAIGRWSCGPATIALLRPGLVSQLWVFAAWPEVTGAHANGSLVATVPGGRTLTPVAEGTCDALAIGRADGTSVDVGPFDVGASP